MKLQIKRLSENATIPTRSTPNSAGLDLVATSVHWEDNELYVCGTGLSVSIPSGYFGMLVPRSSISSRGLSLANSVGIIDADYRGELLVKFHVIESEICRLPYKIGERIAQLIILPYAQAIYITEVGSLEDTIRGAGGFGSTGK